MRINFVKSALKQLVFNGKLATGSGVLAVCADRTEKTLFSHAGFTDVTITGMNPQLLDGSMKPYSAQMADAMKLPFADGSFDWVFVSDGLHHCDSPHRALLEMYRVARVGVIVVESRDSVVQRLAERLMWPRQTYELAAVEGNGRTCGGVNFTCVPNFVYRWTEREFEKTISCFDPTGSPSFRYFYGFNPPNKSYAGVKKYAYSVAVFAVSIVAKIFKKQSNSFCMVAFKPTTLFPWLAREDGELRFKGKA